MVAAKIKAARKLHKTNKRPAPDTGQAFSITRSRISHGFLTEFPEMGRGDPRDLKKGIDAGFRDFARIW